MSESAARLMIFDAAHKNDVEELARLLDARPELIDEKTPDFGRTPLHCACRRGSLQAAELLLQRGADPNCPDAGGQTPLQLSKQEEIANLLRAHGAL